VSATAISFSLAVFAETFSIWVEPFFAAAGADALSVGDPQLARQAQAANDTKNS
jgi:hypothetical protein